MVIEVSQASDARVYNFLLGGSDYYESDRQATRRLAAYAPTIRPLARISRQFLLRAVRYLALEHRVSQFLDHGVGLPIGDSVHQIARRVNKSCRVAYIDNDPMVVAHARMMLADEHTLVLDADMMDTSLILSRCEQNDFLHREVPVGVLFVSSLHCVADERDPWRHIRDLMDVLPSGSFLVLSHLTARDAAIREKVSSVMSELTGRSWVVRSPAEIDRFFEGLVPVGGSVGDVTQWKPGPSPKLKLADLTWLVYGGVARKP
ncbi:SAM-dependent methyltransferase [Streptomyces eurythermus]